MKEKEKIEYWPLANINPYPKNPRINDDAVVFVANSIKEFGFRSPIVVDKDGVVIAGHTRLKAAKTINGNMNHVCMDGRMVARITGFPIENKQLF